MPTENDPVIDTPNEDDLANEIDNDPMIVAMKEAEEELKANPPAQPKEDETTEVVVEAEAGKKEPEGKAADPADKGVMIPKARLDDVLGKLERERERATYLQGIVDTQRQMVAAPGKTDAEAKGQEAAPADDVAAKIEKAENDRLVLAQKYEDGEITIVEFEKGRLELDREIRKLDDLRFDAKVEGAKKASVEVVNANNKQLTIESEAIKIQQEHPYVAAIDSLPKAQAELRWKQIADEAVVNLTEKGINPYDGTVQSRIAFIKEKAALTDKYGELFTGQKLSKQTTTADPKQPSETAIQRAAKLDLANQQPPNTSAASHGVDTPSLTAKDIENMSQDQVADLMTSNPGLVERIVGLPKR